MQKVFIPILFIIFSITFVFSQDSLMTLYVTSEPSGAQIYIDDEISGSTPHTVIKLFIGKHTLKLARNGYEDWITVVNIELADSNKVHAMLNSIRGQIQINSDVQKAYIYIDGKFMGYSPKLIRDIEFGTHYLEIRKSRYSMNEVENLTFKDTIEITDSNVKLVKAILAGCWLTIDSNPSGNDLILDDYYAGTLPLNKIEIEVGSHELFIERDGFESVDETFTIKSGEHKKMMIDLVPMTFNKIFYRSLIFPGIGQIYADRKTRGYLYTFSEIAAIGGAIYMNMQLSDESQIYTEKYNQYLNAANEEDATQLHQEVQDSYDDVQKYEKNRNIFIGVAVAIWLVNIYDAYKLGKNIEESNNDLTSILKKSQLYVQSDNSNYTIGVRLSF